MKMPRCALAIALSIMLFTSSAQGEPVFFGPSSYLSTADIPATLYGGGALVGLENFEDGSLDFGITVSSGTFIFGPDRFADSVDADDGALDGTGSSGKALAVNGSTVTLFFPANARMGGAVWTDGPTGTVTFEAFGPGMVSLGTIGPVAVGDGSFMGRTAEDRFFGVRDTNGVAAIRFTQNNPAIEIDHVQFGVPLPTATVMALALLGALGAARLCQIRRWRGRSATC